jgi:hypothetical protein
MGEDHDSATHIGPRAGAPPPTPPRSFLAERGELGLVSG